MKSILVGTLLAGVLIFNTTISYSQGDVSAGLLQTGMFHAQVALGGMKEAIYYFEKAVSMDGGGEDFRRHAQEALKQAREAYKIFKESIDEADIGVKAEFKKNK